MKYAKVSSPKELATVQFQEIHPGNCPHFIFSGEHYRQDGTCKCNDPNEKIMKSWGYEWNKKTNMWE